MKNTLLNIRRIAALTLGAVVLAVAGCQKPTRPTLPFMTITHDAQVHSANFTLDAKAEGETFELFVASNRDWLVDALTAEGASRITIDPMSGKQGAQTPVSITVTKNEGAKATNAVKVTFRLVGGSEIKRIVSISQQGSVDPKLVYFEDAGTALVDKPSTGWPKVADYTDWLKKGTPNQSGVTYDGKASVRNSKEDYQIGGGAPANAPAPYVYLGANQATAQPFKINGIATGGRTNFTLTWIMQDTKSTLVDSPYTPTFMAISESTIKLRAGFNGADYADVKYTVGDVIGNSWTTVKAEFKVPDGVEKLYLDFGGYVNQWDQSVPKTQVGGLRLDNFTLTEGGNGEILGPGTTPPPSGPATPLFPGSDFNDWNAFKGALTTHGVKDYATESATGGRDGKGAMLIKGKPGGNDYVFTARWPTPAPEGNIAKISFYIKGTAVGKSLSLNVYSDGKAFKAYNLGACTTDKDLTVAENNQYDGEINTDGKWVKVTLEIAPELITKREGNVFALKVGKGADYDLLVDDITYE